jgi:hypothetical protein
VSQAVVKPWLIMARAPGRRRTPWLAVALLLATVGCTDSSPGTDRDAAPADPRLVASVAQFRFDEGTRRLKAGVTNDSDGEIKVTRATIEWDGLGFPSVPLPDEPVGPGQTAAFTVEYGEPRCTRPPEGPPTMVAVVDGRSRRLPLHVDNPGLLVRLRAKACAEQRLDRAASVELRLSTRTEVVDGEEYLPGELVVRHRAGATDRVEIVDLGGSVIIDFVPRAGRDALPATLPSGRRELPFPVLLGSVHRCDAHALGQSSQTFLISAYVRLEGRPTQRVVLPLSSAERELLNGVVKRDCD